jgi:hypothetical protein
MSRHRLKDNVIVGWDHPMLTYFAQDFTNEDEVTGAPGWSIGDSKIREFYDLEPFKQELAKRGIELPLKLEGELYMDKDLGRMG